MAAYIIVQIKVTREQGWPEYRAAFMPLMQRFGGRLLVVDPAVEVLEGTHDGRLSSPSSSPRWRRSTASGTRPSMPR